MMNERKGVVFSIPEENLPVEGCTISKEVAHERDYHCFIFLWPLIRISVLKRIRRPRSFMSFPEACPFMERLGIGKSLQGRSWPYRQVLPSV